MACLALSIFQPFFHTLCHLSLEIYRGSFGNADKSLIESMSCNIAWENCFVSSIVVKYVVSSLLVEPSWLALDS